MVTDEGFFKSSNIIVPKFVTELNKNLDLYGRISYFGKKVNVEDVTNVLKPKAKIPFSYFHFTSPK